MSLLNFTTKTKNQYFTFLNKNNRENTSHGYFFVLFLTH